MIYLEKKHKHIYGDAKNALVIETETAKGKVFSTLDGAAFYTHEKIQQHSKL